MNVNERFKQKVFVIGLPKTATSSLAVALETLGYDLFGHFAVENDNIGTEVHELVLEKLPQYEAFVDVPWCVLYKELDEWCPGSKFILTLRDEEDWLSSVVRHFGYRETPMREWIYGAGDPVGNEDKYIGKYRAHVRQVRSYFSHRPSDLLELKITEGEGWDKLCSFLGHPTIDTSFPKVNTVRERETLKFKLGRLKRMMMKNISGLFEQA